jgi:hypothetical protein
MKRPSEGEDCAESATLLADLVDDDLLELAGGERLWKLYCFVADDSQESGLRHRIYTKRKPDGRLALVTFAVHSPAPGVRARSGIAKVPDLSIDALEHIIDAIRQQTGASDHNYQEIDLSTARTLSDQIRRLADGQLRG